ncbi:MAG: asparagine synthase (glutamine-hydrolyzing) [Planctomycetes bacterium]|nr:asparagine synthase (glutamine-hydrolyzing) [Planctomycetota bacterium]
MCGICGTFNLGDGTPPVDRAQVEAMRDALTHRGPDSAGLHLEGFASLGVRRLRVIDLVTGDQPIYNEDRTVAVVLNGEVYGYQDLRARLEAQGHRFRTRSDTEVLAHLYEEHGEAMLDQVDGMFAFALLDIPRRRLLLARDPMGIKPLYTAVFAGRLHFASELTALRSAGLPAELDPVGVADYLALNYVPGPGTIYTLGRKLEPGVALVVDPEGIRPLRYWSPKAPAVGSAPPFREAVRELRHLLGQAVARQLVADVPVGVFLSGGLDSGSLLAAARVLTNATQGIHTFSAGFREASYSELDGARSVARRAGGEHHELVLGPPPSDDLPRILGRFDEPFGDTSAVPLYYLARLARRHVTVVLSGDGGDEVLGGYSTYPAWRLAQFYRRLPAFLSRDLIPALARRLPVSERKPSIDWRAKRFVRGALEDPAVALYRWKEILDAEGRAAVLGRAPGTPDPLRHYLLRYGAAGGDPLRRLMAVDAGLYLPDDILTKVDRMTMAHSLEARVPLLDLRLVEFLGRLPTGYLVRGLGTKRLLREAALGVLPRAVRLGRKRGFNVPIARWLREELRPLARDCLGSRRLRESGLLEPEAVGRLLDAHERREADHSRAIWGLLALALWLEQGGRARGVA